MSVHLPWVLTQQLRLSGDIHTLGKRALHIVANLLPHSFPSGFRKRAVCFRIIVSFIPYSGHDGENPTLRECLGENGVISHERSEYLYEAIDEVCRHVVRAFISCLVIYLLQLLQLFCFFFGTTLETISASVYWHAWVGERTGKG